MNHGAVPHKLNFFAAQLASDLGFPTRKIPDLSGALEQAENAVVSLRDKVFVFPSRIEQAFIKIFANTTGGQMWSEGQDEALFQSASTLWASTVDEQELGSVERVFSQPRNPPPTTKTSRLAGFGLRAMQRQSGGYLLSRPPQQTTLELIVFDVVNGLDAFLVRATDLKKLVRWKGSWMKTGRNSITWRSSHGFIAFESLRVDKRCYVYGDPDSALPPQLVHVDVSETDSRKQAEKFHEAGGQPPLCRELTPAQKDILWERKGCLANVCPTANLESFFSERIRQAGTYALEGSMTAQVGSMTVAQHHAQKSRSRIRCSFSVHVRVS